MNEVEKMYENAGLSNMWVERYNDGYYEHERYYNSYKEMINNMMKVNDWTLTEAQEVAKRECKKEHPPFTAEKQLEIIKLLCTKRYIDIRFTPEKEYYIFAYYIGCGFNKNFDEALAMFVNQYWQDLTDAEKAQIKEILE